MKYLKKFEEINSQDLSPEELVHEYSEKYPKYENFFKEFLEKFPDKKSFIETLSKYLDDDKPDAQDNDNDDETLDDFLDEFINRCWIPESEVYMLQREFNIEVDTEIWCDFYNDMEGAWEFSSKIKKYNV